MYKKYEKKTYGSSQEVLIKPGEAFVEPQVVPPSTGDKVSKPHVGDFVGNNVRHTLLVKMVGVDRVVQD